jgi:prepilin-type N-terminal cleavage/methylation domain-containing protein
VTHIQDEQRQRPLDEGMTLIEVVVALALFAVMATAVLGVLTQATILTRDDKYRLEAINLATRELEITRDTFTAPTRGPSRIVVNEVVNPTPLSGGSPGDALVVDNVPYTVTRTAQWSAVDSAAATTCDEGTTSELAYLRVRVEVTWPGLEGRPPVTMDTVMTPPKGTYSAVTGHIGVKVINALGQPVGGQPVSVDGPSGVKTGNTSSDGCAVFGFLTAGTYQIQTFKSGHADPRGNSTGSLTAQVQPGELWRGVLEYDRSATISADLTTEPGYSLPAVDKIPVTLGNSALLPSGTMSVVGTSTHREMTPLWPYPSGYQIWAGSCIDNDPLYDGQQGDLPVATPPGGTASTQIPLGALDVQSTPNTALRAKQPDDIPCPSDGRVEIELGPTKDDGTLKTSLPYGTWAITDGGTGTATVTIARGQPAPSVSVGLP